MEFREGKRKETKRGDGHKLNHFATSPAELCTPMLVLCTAGKESHDNYFISWTKMCSQDRGGGGLGSNTLGYTGGNKAARVTSNYVQCVNTKGQPKFSMYGICVRCARRGRFR